MFVDWSGWRYDLESTAQARETLAGEKQEGLFGSSQWAKDTLFITFPRGRLSIDTAKRLVDYRSDGNQEQQVKEGEGKLVGLAMPIGKGEYLVRCSGPEGGKLVVQLVDPAKSRAYILGNLAEDPAYCPLVPSPDGTKVAVTYVRQGADKVSTSVIDQDGQILVTFPMP